MSKRSLSKSIKIRTVQVGILMGSYSDYPMMEETEKILKGLRIPYVTTVASAHRTSDLVRQFIKKMQARGAQVFIAAAGGAAALPGVVAAETIKPVIGVPMTSSLNGLDSLLSMAQMPGGIPVGTMAIGKAGAKNAALLAAAILAVSKPEIAQAIRSYRQDQRIKIINDAKKIPLSA